MRRIARPYAKALLGVAGSLEEAAQVRDQLAAFAATLGTDAKLRAFFANPGLPLDAKRRVLDRLAERLSLLPLSRRLLQALVSRHRLGNLDEVVAGIGAAIQARQGVAVATVTTAEPLADDERSQLRQVLEGKVGKRLELRETVDPALLAGFVARVDSQLFDGSLRGQLDRLAKELAGT
ncbi:MAG TPA: ATP synthase F1 subunit delta [Thermoanaerobaculia bacterium]|nr:ATP synthase F1 subunit delta [Thermoanaerobaculia bacterium]